MSQEQMIAKVKACGEEGCKAGCMEVGGGMIAGGSAAAYAGSFTSKQFPVVRAINAPIAYTTAHRTLSCPLPPKKN